MFHVKHFALNVSRETFSNLIITPSKAKDYGLVLNQDGIKKSAFDLLSYNHISFEDICKIWPQLKETDPMILEQIETEALYSGYLERQEEDILSFKKEEQMTIPESFDYDPIPSLSTEIKLKLKQVKPATIGSASRIQGMTPAAMVTLMAHVKKFASA